MQRKKKLISFRYFTSKYTCEQYCQQCCQQFIKHINEMMESSMFVNIVIKNIGLSTVKV